MPSAHGSFLPASMSLSVKCSGRERQGWAGYCQGQFLARTFGVALEALFLSIREQVGEGRASVLSFKNTGSGPDDVSFWL